MFFYVSLTFRFFLVVNKKVNLAAHETHVASQTQAGVKVGAPPLGPIDISILKDLRDKEIERQKMEYSKLAAHAQQQAMGGRPVNFFVFLLYLFVFLRLCQWVGFR